MACPAGIDIPSYLALVGQGRFVGGPGGDPPGQPLPLGLRPHLPAPLRTGLRPGPPGRTVNIKYLKAFVADYATRHGEYLPLKTGPGQWAQGRHHRLGPAGMSCAHYLALKGYRVTIFEAHA